MAAQAAKSTKQKGRYDWGLLAVVLMMLAFGLVMVLSASYPRGLVFFNDKPYFFITRQIMWVGVGLVALFLAARIRYDLWERLSILMMAVALIALIAVLFFGDVILGSRRTFAEGSIQPSEPAKIIIIIYVSTWLASKGERIRDVKVGLLPFSMLMGFIAVLIVAQPDISTATLIVLTAMVMFFIAGADLRQLAVVLAVGAATFWLVVSNSAHASNRIQKYWASLNDPMQSTEWQVRYAVEALSRGGVFGVGMGNSEAKLGPLPLSWSDNIFPIIGEELGLMGCLLVVLLFVLFAYRGLRTALSAADNFGMLLATGITCIIILQAILNLAVAVAAVPPTGVPLPFISYGGSSLATTLGAVGILLSISRYGSERIPQTARQASKTGSTKRTSRRDGQTTRQSTGRAGEAAYARFDFRRGNGRSRVSGAGRRTAASRSSGSKSSSKRSAVKRQSSRRKSSDKSATRGATGRAARAQSQRKRTVAKRR